MHEFLADKSPKAFEKVIDRLLASPRYGERWGRHWLDVMRYADSTGSDEDHRYPHACRYRDYVVEAFNNDMPYNQFVREQLAGASWLPIPALAWAIAVLSPPAFSLWGKKALAQKDLPLKRYHVVDDQIDVTAKAFMGLTITCARCHDHKFDPIATKDYYQLAAIFASTLSYEKGETGDPIQTPLAAPGEFETFDKQWTAYNKIDEKLAKIINFDEDAKKNRDVGEAQIASSMQAAYRVYAKGEPVTEVAAAAKLEEKQLARWVEYLKNTKRPELVKWHTANDVNRADVAAEYQEDFHRSAYQYDQDVNWWKEAPEQLPEIGQGRRSTPANESGERSFLRCRMARLRAPASLQRRANRYSRARKGKGSVDIARASRGDGKNASRKEIPMACAVKEGETMNQRVFLRGDYHSLGDPVDRTVPSILRISAPAPEVKTKSGRLELADWIVDPRNPAAAPRDG